jgi:hypothetical protein
MVGHVLAAPSTGPRYRPDVRATELPGFLPSTSGFRFVNRWPAGAAFELRLPYLRLGIGEVADGLCGGMCLAAADRFLRGEPIPSDGDAPGAGSPLFKEIARRQLDSLELGFVAARFWWVAARVAADRWSARDQVREWRGLRADLAAGRPAMAGLVRSAGVNPFGLNTNHQVLGFGCDATAGAGRLRIYDPNHPGDDGVAILIRRLGAGARPAISLEQTTGEPLLALLRLPYHPPGG